VSEKPRRVLPTTLSEALQEWIARSGLGPRIEQAEVLGRWAELVGPQIAQVTEPESITPDGVLRVRVTTAPWANELSLMTPMILGRLNEGRNSKGRFTGIRWFAGSSDEPGKEAHYTRTSWRKNRKRS
jgi:predicted nucleic acid-binding Zn ribbon protein